MLSKLKELGTYSLEDNLALMLLNLKKGINIFNNIIGVNLNIKPDFIVAPIVFMMSDDDNEDNDSDSNSGREGIKPLDKGKGKAVDSNSSGDGSDEGKATKEYRGTKRIREVSWESLDDKEKAILFRAAELDHPGFSKSKEDTSSKKVDRWWTRISDRMVRMVWADGGFLLGRRNPAIFRHRKVLDTLEKEKKYINKLEGSEEGTVEREAEIELDNKMLHKGRLLPKVPDDWNPRTKRRRIDEGESSSSSAEGSPNTPERRQTPTEFIAEKESMDFPPYTGEDSD